MTAATASAASRTDLNVVGEAPVDDPENQISG
jgi:hypothetical protein